MWVIKNLTDAPLPFEEGVTIDPGKQYTISHLTPDMLAAKEAGKLQIKDGNETLEERRANIKAINEGLGDV